MVVAVPDYPPKKKNNFRCNQCSHVADTESALKDHAKRHSLSSVTITPIPPRSPAKMIKLKTSAKSPKVTLVPGDKEKDCSPSVVPNCCPHCPKVFISESKLSAHVERAHANWCASCEKSFDSPVTLSLHQKREDCKHACLHCDAFAKASATQVRLHVISKHLDKTRTLCQKCAFFAKTQAEVKAHVEQMHSEPKAAKRKKRSEEPEIFPCEQCPTVLTNYQAWKDHADGHVKAEETPDAETTKSDPLQADTEGEEFSWPVVDDDQSDAEDEKNGRDEEKKSPRLKKSGNERNVPQRRKRESNEFNHPCNVCGKRFSRKDSVRRHLENGQCKSVPVAEQEQ